MDEYKLGKGEGKGVQKSLVLWITICYQSTSILLKLIMCFRVMRPAFTPAISFFIILDCKERCGAKSCDICENETRLLD